MRLCILPSSQFRGNLSTVSVINRILYSAGAKSRRFASEFGSVSILLWRTLSFLPATLRRPQLLLEQMNHIGVGSLPLVIVIGFFTGMVSAWQAAYQFKGFIPMLFVGSAVSRAIFIELGPVLTAIVIAGRVGASIASEIATMKVTEQLDALESMAISPIRYLAAPRILAAFLMMPVLVIFANLIALLGAFIVSNFALELSPHVFFGSVRRFFHIEDVTGGIIKSFVFGGVTSLLGVFVGFTSEGSAAGVGKATIRAFVLSSAAILISDYVLWTILY